MPPKSVLLKNLNSNRFFIHTSPHQYSAQYIGLLPNIVQPQRSPHYNSLILSRIRDGLNLVLLLITLLFMRSKDSQRRHSVNSCKLDF